jgi:hypothetical protein
MKSSVGNETAKAADSITQKDKEYSHFIENFEVMKKNVNIYIYIFNKIIN